MAAHESVGPAVGTETVSEGVRFFDSIFFAMVAAFILLRLRGVLGKRTGNERRPPNPLARRPVEDDSEKVIRLPDREATAPSGGDDFSDVGDAALAGGFARIKRADSSFERRSFLEGARTAFEFVVGAYAAGDSKALRPLLAEDVFVPFARAIRDREADGHTLETVIVSFDEAEIIEAGMNGRTAFITVRFVSHQVNVTSDADDNLIEGGPDDAVEVVDIWTFERDTRSSDPNWTLAATRSPN